MKVKLITLFALLLLIMGCTQTHDNTLNETTSMSELYSTIVDLKESLEEKETQIKELTEETQILINENERLENDLEYYLEKFHDLEKQEIEQETKPDVVVEETEKNIYTIRESYTLFGEKRWSEIQCIVLDYIVDDYIRNKGCFPTPCKRDYWSTIGGGETTYYLNENYWTIEAEVKFKDDTNFWYENYIVTIDQNTNQILTVNPPFKK